LRPEIQDGDAQPVHVDARIVPRLRDRVFHEHRRHDEEPGGDRDLPAQQRPLTARLWRAEDADTRCQLSPEIARARQLQRRFEPEHDQRNQQGPRRDPERGGVWRRTDGHDPASSHGKHEVEFDVHQNAQPLEDPVGRHAACGRQEQAFGALFTDEAPARRPQGPPDGNFVLSRRTSREHEIREVRAGDGEHQGHQRDNGLCGAAQGRVLTCDRRHRFSLPRPFRCARLTRWGARWKARVQGRGDRGHLRGGGRRRGCWRQPPEHHQLAAIARGNS
jgi:hypothetical protein